MLDTQPVLVIAFAPFSGGTTRGTRHTLNVRVLAWDPGRDRHSRRSDD